MTNHRSLLLIHPDDNVAVALRDLAAGERVTLGARTLTLAESVPAGHKVSVQAIAYGASVTKYGQPIGQATENIAEGRWVHEHNLATNLGPVLDYRYQPVEIPDLHGTDALTFEGYPRANGEVGTRNEIWILPTAGCANTTVQRLARLGHAEFAGKGNDGVFAFPHPYGCSQLGEDHTTTQRLLADLVRHPNAGGVLVVGLGCENNHLAAFKEVLGEWEAPRLRFLNCQEVEDEIGEGLRLLGELAAHTASFRRQTRPLSALKVGLKCGGSDSLSGVTANPLVGRVVDALVGQGASAVLTEVPEMFGAEHLLMARCMNPGVFAETVRMVNDFKDYYLRHDQVIYENPAPGNRAGGITTLEEKSLGCIQKGGRGPIVGVLAYGERVARPGVNLLSAPGNDLVAVTALAAAGVHLVLFTTGRGTPLGGPVPCIKIASNRGLAARKAGWIDFDAGTLLDGGDWETSAEELLRLTVAVASGQPTRSERNGCREIAIWKDGVTL